MYGSFDVFVNDFNEICVLKYNDSYVLIWFFLVKCKLFWVYYLIFYWICNVLILKNINIYLSLIFEIVKKKFVF